ncbi:MAG TPA: DciA family protein [Gammaproteobacteria bacterium]|nr:DciA family protein [Gammaproteobacteria bacterium]
MKPQKHSMIEILTISPILSQIVNKVEQLAKLNRIVHQKCNPELRKHCRVANYRDGILILTTHSSAVGHLLRFEKSELLTALRSLPEWCHLKSIKIHVRPNPPESEIIPIPTSETGAFSFLPSQVSTELKKTALNINFPPLQQALLRLAGSKNEL